MGKLRDSEEKSQEDTTDVPEAKEKPKGQAKEKEKGKGNEKGKGKKKAKKVKVNFNWREKALLHPKREGNPSVNVTHPSPDNHSPFDVFSVVTNLDPILKLLVDQSNLYVQQNGRWSTCR